MGNNEPFAIGIAGDSGSGKTILVSTMEKILGADHVVLLDGDADHKWERGDVRWQFLTHLNPAANNLSKQAIDLSELKSGKAIYRSEYDHESGKFTKPKEVRPRPYIVLCGLHSLYLPETRRNLDLMIYMDIDESLRRSWKIRRDVEERGHSEDKVLQEMIKRMPDASKYVYPQREYADLSIRYFCEPTDKLHENLYFQIASYTKFDMDSVEKCLLPYSLDFDYYSDVFRGRNIISVHGPRMESKYVNLKDIISPLNIKSVMIDDISIDLLHVILSMFILCAIDQIKGGKDDSK